MGCSDQGDSGIQSQTSPIAVCYSQQPSTPRLVSAIMLSAPKGQLRSGVKPIGATETLNLKGAGLVLPNSRQVLAPSAWVGLRGRVCPGNCP